MSEEEYIAEASMGGNVDKLKPKGLVHFHIRVYPALQKEENVVQ